MSKVSFKDILAGKTEPIFWLGCPLKSTHQIYCNELGINVPEEIDLETASDKQKFDYYEKFYSSSIQLHKALNSSMFWVPADLTPLCWKPPNNEPVYITKRADSRNSLSSPGVFENTCNIEEINKHYWPNPKHWNFDFARALMQEAKANDLYVASGMWFCFFHILCDHFGMESYFMKMITQPEIVTAATKKLVQFQLDSNKIFFDQNADLIDVAFFGNDFGSQLDLLISPEQFREFVLPYTKEYTAQMKDYNIPIMLHSCGSISKIIPDLIEIGIECLHPIQAKAVNMNAEYLMKNFGGKIAFCGGIDTQELLPFGTASEVSKEVMRLKNIFKNKFIFSPSHEALLPNVPLANVIAMSKA